MKRAGIYILTAAMLASSVSLNTDAKEPEQMTAADISGHVEVEGEDPVYPQAPEGYDSYEDYKQNSDWVHDTDFYYDTETKTWYRYITNSSRISSSQNLVNWEREETGREGNAWAPCIVKLREPVEYEGTSYAYALWDSLSTFGTRESWIRLWLSNSPSEGFVQAGDTVVSKLNDGKNHNAIDPSVFYDKEGKMWMTFGSFFGGIYLLELDPATCMPKNPDEVPGKRIAYRSTYGNSIEGPAILYNPDTDYYYLNVSYGSLDHTYNVRIGRSRNVEGPYYDYNGLPMDNEGYQSQQTSQIGTKITSPYYFEPDNGWYSTGHSSFLYNPDTDEYFLSHNARLETIAEGGTRLNIRKLYWTEDGWPVVSPELYAEGEKEQKIPTRCIAGEYQIVELLRKDLSVSPISSVKRGNEVIVLEEDHSISGAYEGSWIQTGDCTLELTLGDVKYNVTVAAAWDWENWTETLVFTGLSEAADTPEKALVEERSGVGIWGKKADAETLVKSVIEKYTLPEIVRTDIEFPETACKGVKMTVESLQPDVITSEGKLLQPRPEKNLTVDFKITFSTDRYSEDKIIRVTVPAYKGSVLADIKLNGELRDSSTYERTVTPGSGEYTYETGIVGQALRNKTIGTNTDNLVRLEDNILNIEKKETFTINLWIRPDALTEHTAVFFTKGDGRWMTIMPCSNKTEKLSIRVRDDAADVWSDLDSSKSIPTGVWSMITYVYDKGTTILYLNGEEAARSSDIVNPFNSYSQSFYLGGNSWDPSFNGLIDEVKIYDCALEGGELKSCYEKMCTVIKPADKEALNSLIETAGKQAEEIRVSADGKDIAKEEFWVTAEQKDAFVQAVKRASAVAEDKDADQNLTDAAAEELKAKMKLLEIEQKKGLKEPEAEKLPFVDVTEADWFYDAVYYNYFADIMTGTDPEHFSPGNILVRAQVAVIIYRLAGEPEVTGDYPFADGRQGWYEKAVTWAAGEDVKIITGYSDSNNFGPNDPITREQMATMMYRYANYKKSDVAGTADYSSFADADDIGVFAKDGMNWAVAHKIITGKDLDKDGKEEVLQPYGGASRAECATIIQRFMEKYPQS